MKRFDLFSSPWFIIGLLTLLVNDFFLKDFFHNWITGKLSDFAGLLIFPLFWSVFFPKYKKQIFIFTALFFIWWKAPFSGSFINFWNITTGYHLARVVDFSDLIALSILPVSYLIEKKNQFKLKVNPAFVAILAFFAFAATSSGPRIQYKRSPVVVFQKMDASWNFIDTNIWGIVPIITDTIQGYSRYRYDGGYGENNLEIVEFDEYILFKARDFEYGNSKIFDDYYEASLKEKMVESVKRQLADTNMVDEFVFENLVVMESLRIQSDCFGPYELFEFKDSYLHGEYKKFDNFGKVLVEGNYLDGVEVGTWVNYDSEGNIENKTYFKKGEKLKLETYLGGEVFRTESFSTRSDLKQDVMFVFAMLIFLSLSAVFWMFARIRIKDEEETPPLNRGMAATGSIIGVPIIAIILAKIIQSYIPVIYGGGDFISAAIVIIVFYIIALLATLTYFILKHRSLLDTFLFFCFFVFSFLSYEQWLYLKDIMN